MANIVKSVFIGGLIASSLLGFTACQNSKQGQTRALDASPKRGVAPATGAGAQQKADQKAQQKVTCDAIKSLKASKDPADVEKLKALEGNLQKGSLDAKWILLNERLLEQAHVVFVEVWKKLEPEMQTVPTSVFAETRSRLLSHFTADEGLPVAKSADTPASVSKSSIVPVLVRGEDCLPKSLELQIVDAKNKKQGTYALLTFNTKGQFEWRFNSSLMPEAVGQRLQTLGQDIYCNARYLKGGQLSFLNCVHLGQEGYANGSTDNKVRVEFDRFFYDIAAKDFTFEGSESRYSDLVNPDPIYSKKEIKVRVDLGPIYRKYTKTPGSEETKTPPLDPRLDLNGALPAVSEVLAPATTAVAATAPKNQPAEAEEPQVPEVSATSQGDQRDIVKPVLPALKAATSGRSPEASGSSASLNEK